MSSPSSAAPIERGRAVGSFLNPIRPARVAKVCAWCSDVIEPGLAPASHGICSRCRRGSLARRIAPHLRSGGRSLAVIVAFVGLAVGLAACEPVWVSEDAPGRVLLEICVECDTRTGICFDVSCEPETVAADQRAL